MLKLNWMYKGFKEFTLQGYLRKEASFDPLPHSTNISVLITGSNQGIGFASAQELAQRGAIVHLAVRNKERGEKAKQQILDSFPDSKVFVHQLDISKLSTIKPTIQEIARKHAIHVVVNNAGCMIHSKNEEEKMKDRLTEDGYEVNCATNTLGTYLTTKCFLESENCNVSKVITVSSGGMYTENLDPNFGFEKNWKDFPLDATQMYAQNKRQQVVMMEELDKKYEGVTFATMHPGWAETEAVKNAMPGFHRQLAGRWRSPAQGADTIVWLALTDQIPSGKFWLDRTEAPTKLTCDWSRETPSMRKQLMENLDKVYNDYK